MLPIIGITITHDLKKMYVNQDYIQAIEQAGGVPLMLPFVNNPIMIEKLVNKCDGLLLTGGEDVDPFYYGEEPITHLGEIVPDRDELELNVFQLFLQQNKPILAICRGCQLMNVAFGGSLYQDIPSQTSSQIKHVQQAPRGYATHSIQIKKDTLLHSVLREENIRVNSYHHQAAKSIKSPLVVSAHSSDGIIEAIESTSHPYLLGIQWHPEGMAILQDKYAMRLFSSFTQVCNSHSE